MTQKLLRPAYMTIKHGMRTLSLCKLLILHTILVSTADIVNYTLLTICCSVAAW